MTGANVAPPASDAGVAPETVAAVPRLGAWRPVESVEHDAVSARAVLALHDLLDDGSAAAPAPEGIVPILWHWLAFLPRAAQHDLDTDGHPRRGGFLPPVPSPRRMIAGGRVELRAPTEVDAPLVRRGIVTSLQEKNGRSGPLVLVTARFETGPASRAAGGAHAASEPATGETPEVLVVEEQDIVYRGAATGRVAGPSATAVAAPPGSPAGSPPAPVAAGGGAAPGAGDGGAQRAVPPPPEGPDAPRWQWRWDLEVDPRLLFRFSALTYNAHRIHYDRPWATEVEGYPGLVVHGPLQAIALAELCRRHSPHSPLTSFAYRATSPKFDDGPLLLRGAPDGTGGVELRAYAADGTATMQASASFAR